MKFGQELAATRAALGLEHSDAWLRYRALKKSIHVDSSHSPLTARRADFSSSLKFEMSRINLHLHGIVSMLEADVAMLGEMPRSEAVSLLTQRCFAALTFIEWNATGLHKISKKFDKAHGSSILPMQAVVTGWMQQEPFCTELPHRIRALLVSLVSKMSSVGSWVSPQGTGAALTDCGRDASAGAAALMDRRRDTSASVAALTEHSSLQQEQSWGDYACPEMGKAGGLDACSICHSCAPQGRLEPTSSPTFEEVACAPASFGVRRGHSAPATPHFRPIDAEMPPLAVRVTEHIPASAQLWFEVRVSSFDGQSQQSWSVQRYYPDFVELHAALWQSPTVSCPKLPHPQSVSRGDVREVLERFCNGVLGLRSGARALPVVSAFFRLYQLQPHGQGRPGDKSVRAEDSLESQTEETAATAEDEEPLPSALVDAQQGLTVAAILRVVMRLCGSP